MSGKARENYRAKYKRYYGIEFDAEYVVHHIDGDRENNDIRNLVLLPRELHSRYHFQKAVVEGQPLPTVITGNALHSQSYFLSCLEEFMETIKECNKWYDYKLFLEGAIPNIHGIQLNRRRENGRC